MFPVMRKCSCCGEPNTCTECEGGDCCFSDQSTATITSPEVDMTAGCTGCKDLGFFGAQAKASIPFIGMFEEGHPGGPTIYAKWYLKEFIDVGANEYYEWTVRFACFYNEWQWTRYYNLGDEIEGYNCFMNTGLVTGGGCCGFDDTTLISASGFNTTGCDPDPANPTLATSVDIANNKCCQCEVDEAPTCVVSTKDYCPNDGDGACDQFTGEEAFCDDAP